MQTTSALYKSILAADGHWFENKLVVDGVGTFDEAYLYSVKSRNDSVNGKPEIGKAVSAELDASLLFPPEMSIDGVFSGGVDISTDLLEGVTWESGYWNDSGAPASSSNTQREIDYIPVVPNQTYLYYSEQPSTVTQRLRIHEYNSSKVWLRQIVSAVAASKSFKASSDAAYIRLSRPVAATVYNLWRAFPPIPRMATLRPFVRVCNTTQQSEWIPQNVFFVDTRAVTNNDDGLSVLTIHGYDAIMKAEQDYPNTSHSWPYLDKLVVAEIAAAIGVTVDSRTNAFLSAGYMIDLPVSYTMRETLKHIAAMYAGNFVMSNEGKLLFVPLFGFDSDEWLTGNYFSDENGNALVFGNEGWYCLV